MSDLIERMRRKAENNRSARWPADVESCEDDMDEAADEIERLQARVVSDESQLCRIAQYLDKDARHGPDGDKTIAGLVISEIERLQEIVRRLPTTADGVPVEQTSIGVKVWRSDGPEGMPQQCTYYQNGFAVFDSRVHFRGEFIPVQDCYSTREAAEKARELNP